MGYSKEDHTTIACVNWFKHQYPKAVIFHVANERNTKRKIGKRYVTTGEGAKLKKMGVMKGVSDIVITEWHPNYRGLFIELKPLSWKDGKQVKAGYPSEDQRQFLSDQFDRGYAVAVAWGLDEFMAYVNAYMSHEPVECEYLIRNEHIEV